MRGAGPRRGALGWLAHDLLGRGVCTHRCVGAGSGSREPKLPIGYIYTHTGSVYSMAGHKISYSTPIPIYYHVCTDLRHREHAFTIICVTINYNYI